MNMLKKTASALLLTVMAALQQSYAVTVNIPQQLTAGMDKGKFIQESSGFDGSRHAAYMQADMTFSNVCRSTATIENLKRIASTSEFETLYSKLKSGRIVGMNESRNILVTDKKTFCRG
ncbi:MULTISPECIES: hypothetical protein [unclassified Pantoea]